MAVIVYSSPYCTYCKKLKNFLQKNKIEFIEKDVVKDPAAAIEAVEKSGQMSLPILDNGIDIIVGFDEQKLREFLNLKE